MKTTILLLLLAFCISNFHAQESKIVYTVPTAGEPIDLKNDITSDGDDLYVVIESDIYVLTYDENNQTTSVKEIISIDSPHFSAIINLFLTDDWFYFSTANSRAIRRINRNDANLTVETVVESSPFPSAVLATQDKLYFADYITIYKVDLSSLPATPELLIEDARLPMEQTKITMVGSVLYVAGRDVLFKINTLTDDIEEIQTPGLEEGTTFVGVSDSKLIGVNSSRLYLLDTTDDSLTLLGSISCAEDDPEFAYACGGVDMTLVDSTLFLSTWESPHVRALVVPSTVYADVDNDHFGDPLSSIDVERFDFSTGFVFDATDCDDNNPNVNPDQTEIVNNGIDDDCNPETIDDTTSSVQMLSNTQVKIYPIPASEVLYIDTQTPIKFQGNIYDMKGSLISTFDQNQVDLSGIPAGSYWLELQDLDSLQKIVEHIVIVD